MTGNETILITGATGFVGSWLVEALHQSGHPGVKAGIRSWSSAARLGRTPVDIVMCDVMKPDQVKAAMEGVTHVIHCAIGSDDVTIEGTRNVLEAAAQQNVERVVHVSTTEIYGETAGPVTEMTPAVPGLNAYGDAKIEAEKVVQTYRDKGLSVAIVRPPIVYGPFSEYWVARMADKLRSGNWMLYEGLGEGNCNLIYITDLIKGIMLALRHENAINQDFILNGPEVITWNQYFERLNAAMGLPPLQRAAPSNTRMKAMVMAPIKSSAKFALNHFEGPLQAVYQRNRQARTVMQWVEKKMKTTANLGDLNLYNRKAFFRHDKARDLIGYEPDVTIDEGVRLSVLWLRHVGLAPKRAS